MYNGKESYSINTIGCVVVVFIICFFIDLIRIKLVEKPFFRWFDYRWEKISKALKRKEESLFSKFNIL